MNQYSFMLWRSLLSGIKTIFLIWMAGAQLLLAYAYADVPMVVDDGLVDFHPAVLTASGSECQGIRIARKLVVTSPPCAQAINKLSEKNEIQIQDALENSLGKVIPAQRNPSLNPMDHEMLLDISDAVASDFDTYPVLRNSDTPISEGFAYFKDQDGSIVKKRASVTQLSSSEMRQRFYDVSTDSALPSGAIVMDDKNHLVCLISSRNQCIGVPLGQAFLTRKLEQYEDTDDLAGLWPFIGQATIVVMLIAGAIGTFYTVLFIRSRQLGIPASTYWGGICSYGYCREWDGLSTVLCTLGVGCFIPTAGYSGTLCWATPFITAWNWLRLKSLEISPLSGMSDTIIEPLLNVDNQSITRE